MNNMFKKKIMVFKHELFSFSWKKVGLYLAKTLYPKCYPVHCKFHIDPFANKICLIFNERKLVLELLNVVKVKVKMKKLTNSLNLTELLDDFSYCYKYLDMQLCKYAGMQLCMYVGMQFCRYVVMQVCRHSGMQANSYGSMYVCKYEFK